MPQEKTPGVYIVEKPAFPNSVVEVATGVPVFLGYTEKAIDGARPIAAVPMRISSMGEFIDLFGGPPTWSFHRNEDGLLEHVGQRFYLYQSLRLFFDNGGGPCWIVSVGGYGGAEHGPDDFANHIWTSLEKEQEPSIVLAPDAVALGREGHKVVSEAMMSHCQKVQSRVAILDIYDGCNPDMNRALNDPKTGFRNTLSFGDHPSYGIAYAPWLHTSIMETSDIDVSIYDQPSRNALADEIMAEQATLAATTEKDLPQPVKDLVDELRNPPDDASGRTRMQNALTAISPLFKERVEALLEEINILPPSGAMAGVFARTDNTLGVFKAPANTGVMSVTAPCVSIDHDMQEDMKIPLDGYAVNAIRSFMGRGVLAWGARTLDGNSQDYRYVSVRRTLIMLEQSIYYAAQAYVFEPNTAGTWTSVQTMLENFLNNQWKAGALAGTNPAEAYDVSVGLGSTMTGNDILDGYMRVTVRVAITRPAEFIVITFQQKMQTS